MWVILPLKDLVLAKQRLSGVLSDSERRALFQAMVEDVLDALCASDKVEQVVLVSDDPTAPLLAEHYNILCWSEAELRGPDSKGLNATLQAAVAQLAGQGQKHVMIVHGDLPLLTTTDVDTFIDNHEAADAARKMTLNSDDSGTGTNVLALTPPDLLRFEYGSQSAQLHAEQAEECGALVQLTRLPGMCTDIDDVEDLIVLAGSTDMQHAAATRRYLGAAGLIKRLQLIADHEPVNDGVANMRAISAVQHFE